MPTLKEVLAKAQPKRAVRVAEVSSKIDSRTYNVTVGGRVIKAKAAVSVALPQKTRVVLADTDDGLYIVGTEELKTREMLEVIING